MQDIWKCTSNLIFNDLHGLFVCLFVDRFIYIMFTFVRRSIVENLETKVVSSSMQDNALQ